jgi:hypothetical protein
LVATKLVHDCFPGQSRATLDLGFDSYRQIALLKHLAMMASQRQLIKQLRENNVLRRAADSRPKMASGIIRGVPNFQFAGDADVQERPATGAMALNFVSGWDAIAASYIVLSPTVVSIILAVAWPVVAVRVFEADAQASVQTATSVASYIVTAGEKPRNFEIMPVFCLVKFTFATGALLIALATWYDAILAS